MKTFLASALLLLTVSACKDENSGFTDKVLMKSYVPMYVDNALKVYPYNSKIYENGKIGLLFCRIHEESDILEGQGRIYWAPELGSTGEEAERFLKIAERNGDRNYNRYEDIDNWCNRTACADNFKSMQVKCLNGSWDEKHPAGSSLNDIITIKYYSVADFIKKGYPEIFNGTYWIPLSELAETDLWVIGTQIELYWDAHPAAGSYEMEVTLVTTEGVEKKATCTLEIK